MPNPRLRFKKADGTDYPDWEDKKLGDICKTFSGGTPRTGVEEYYNGNINFIRSGEIHNSKTELFISEEGLKNSSAKLVNVGDILLALYGATSGEIDLSKINGAINQAILCIRPQEGFNKKFIVESFRYNKNNILKFYLQGGQGNLSAQNILKLEFPFPCLEEQEKIADFLSDIDEFISLSDQEVKKLQELKKGAMQKIFSQEIRFKKDDGTDYPDWEEKKLGELGTFAKGANLSKADISEIGTPFILYGELYTTYDEVAYDIKRKTEAIVDEKYYSKKGDVLIPTSGETAEEISKATCVMQDGVILAGDLNIFRNDTVDGRIISYILNYQVKKDIAKIAQGKMIVHLQSKNLAKILINYPVCLEEQQKIGDFLSDIDEAISLAKQELEKWKLLKKGLLQQMFV